MADAVLHPNRKQLLQRTYLLHTKAFSHSSAANSASLRFPKVFCHQAWVYPHQRVHTQNLLHL
ncbi:MAG: hypothetical protein IKM64_10175, partial [Clostridia bacterium]|nr:hypothetical protein [Clostridia bacterium]